MQQDILSDVLRTVRLTGAIFFDVEASAPWVATAPPSRAIAERVLPGTQHVIEYHVLVAGECWARLSEPGSEPVRMAPGSVVVFPQGHQHTMSSDPALCAEPDLSAFEPTPKRDVLPFYLDYRREGGDCCQLICGFLGCDVLPFNPLLRSLPPVLHVAGGYGGDGLLGQLIRATVEEARATRPGSGGVLAKLSELIFIEVIRRHAESLPAGAGGWLTGLRDPGVGRAIRLIHAAPARDWTLAELAREAGLSRTVLAQRFTEFLGVPPMAYLLNWRMQRAAALLTGGAASLAQVSVEVGYDSEAAFSRAFKRCTGQSPSAWRRSGGRAVVEAAE